MSLRDTLSEIVENVDGGLAASLDHLPVAPPSSHLPEHGSDNWDLYCGPDSSTPRS